MINKEIDEYPTTRLQKVNNLIRRAKEFYNERDDYLLECDKEYMHFKHIFPDGDTTEYINFIKSDYFKYIPWQYIAIHILANFFSKKSEKPMGNGEWKDIEYISSYLPYCNYMLIDYKQFNVLKNHKLDERFKTEVSISENFVFDLF